MVATLTENISDGVVWAGLEDSSAGIAINFY